MRSEIMILLLASSFLTRKVSFLSLEGALQSGHLMLCSGQLPHRMFVFLLAYSFSLVLSLLVRGIMKKTQNNLWGSMTLLNHC